MILTFFLDRRYGRWGADNSDNFVVKVDRVVMDTVDQVVLNMVEAAVDEVVVYKEGIVSGMVKFWEFWIGRCNVLVRGEIKKKSWRHYYFIFKSLLLLFDVYDA